MSPRSEDARADRVRRLLAAAARVRDGRAGLASEISRETGLSLEGIELALVRHLETDATPDDLERLVARAGDARAVLVVLSANVFTGALRALALACACGEEVAVRPSRRESAFVRALVAAANDPSLVLVGESDPSGWREGEIHVYGRDETVEDVRRRAPSGVRVRGFGSGISVAAVSPSADLAASARRLADDVVPFDQRGCLSPRVALVEGDAARAGAFAEALHAGLTDAAARTPRGAVFEDERADLRRYEETMAFGGQVWTARDHLVGLASAGAPLLVPPTGRHVHVVAVSDAHAMRVLLAPIAPHVVGLGADDPGRYTGLVARARFSKLGEMQRPPLDGPVDLREP